MQPAFAPIRCVISICRIMVSAMLALMSLLWISNSANAAPDVFSNVPEASTDGYVLVYTLPIQNAAGYSAPGSVPYSVDNSAMITGPFDRIAYYLELDDGNGLVYAYASMDAFTNNVQNIGLPISGNGISYQQNVSKMNVVSNSKGIVTGTGIATGNIEFWPTNYGTNNLANVPNASDSQFDFGDFPANTGAYGSFQIHNYGASQTLFAYNQWGGNNPMASGDLGIGNNTSNSHSDWTFTNNAHTYTVKNLQILVRPSTLAIDLTLQRAVFQRDRHNQGSIPVTGFVADEIDFVEARAVARPGSSGATSTWKTIATNPPANFFSDSLQVFSSWYDIEIRAWDGKSIADEQTVERVGIGDVFITCGQSNSANHGSDLLTPAEDQVSATNLTNWRHAADPQPIATGGGGSPWPALGDSLVQDNGVPVGFISVGWGGTSVEQWVPGNSGPDVQPLYLRLQQALQKVGPNGARAVLWHQGESDNILDTTTKDYVQRLEAIIAQSRIDAGFDIPWGIAQVSFVPDHIQQSVIDAQAQVAANDPLNFAGPGTDDMTGPVWRAPDLIHFNENGLREHADRWRTSINQHFSTTSSIAPDGRKLLDGQVFAGTLLDVQISDDVDFKLDPNPTTNPFKQKIDVLVVAETTVLAPANFAFCLESAMQGGPSGDVLKTIALWNFQDRGWDIVSSEFAAESDTSIISHGNETPVKYVHQTTGEVIARLTWESPAFTGKPFFWSVDIDQALWLIEQ